MPRLTEPPSGTPNTAAGRRYWENSKRLAQLVLVVVRSAEHFADEIRRLAQSGVTVADTALSARLDADFNRLSQGSEFLSEWNVVMAVTFAEAFLHDVLVECSLIDSTLLGDAEPSASYIEVSSAVSLAALRHEMHSKWARSFVDVGGPRRWSDRLERMGVRDLPLPTSTLEEIWGIRHAIVHRAGVASAEFVRRHPGLDAQVGLRIALNSRQVIEYVGAIDAFVRPVDVALAARMASRTSAPAV